MSAYLWLLGLWLTPADLGSPDYYRREAAAQRLTSAGPFATPFLMPLARSENAEVRATALRLANRYASLLSDVALAHEWLSAEATPERLAELRTQSSIRYRVADAFRRCGLLRYHERQTMADDWLDWTGIDDGLYPSVTDTESAWLVARERWNERNGK